jgi:hypothetical protein
MLIFVLVDWSRRHELFFITYTFFLNGSKDNNAKYKKAVKHLINEGSSMFFHQKKEPYFLGSFFKFIYHE